MPYVNPTSLIVVSSLFMGFGIIATCLRFYGRWLKGNKLLIDDWLTLPALTFTIASAIETIVGSATHHMAYKPPYSMRVVYLINNAITFFKYEYVFYCFNTIALTCMKCSVLFFYRRVFSGRRFDIISWTLIGLVTVWGVGFFFGWLFQCGSAFWGYNDATPTAAQYCLHRLTIGDVFAISDVVMDICILAIPPPLLWNLNLPKRKKVFVGAALMLGGLSLAAAIGRMIIFLVLNSQTKSIPTGSQADPKSDALYNQRNTLQTENEDTFWSMVEVGIAMIAVNSPLYRAVWTESTVCRRVSNAAGAKWSWNVNVGSSLRSLVQRDDRERHDEEKLEELDSGDLSTGLSQTRGRDHHLRMVAG